jgi:ribose/xylose/arabinose/galactoside ABC-type transport system permease subunit
MLTSFLAGLCGIIFATVRKTIYAVYGVGMELEVIGATIIGGTSLLGGYGTVIGTIFGATLLAMVYLGIVTVVPTASIPGFSPAYLYEGAVGTLIIVTTVLNIKLGGLRERFRR